MLIATLLVPLAMALLALGRSNDLTDEAAEKHFLEVAEAMGDKEQALRAIAARRREGWAAIDHMMREGTSPSTFAAYKDWREIARRKKQ